MAYQELYKSGKLQEIALKLKERLKACDLCPRNCLVNRANDELGFCGAGKLARVSSAFLHFGEEPEIVGKGGSGTIFFSFCNLGCIYCQNYSISNIGEGHDISAEMLADNMLKLKSQGAENINFVTPTHYIAQIIESLVIAVEKGLNIPLVYNCGGYEKAEVLKLVEGVFDIFMPDIKYSDREVSEKYSQAGDYWEVVKGSVKEMHRQVGDLEIDSGVVKKGLLIRHLVLPQKQAGSFKVLDFIKEEISADTYVNIMKQYFPCFRADEYDELKRRITFNEYDEVVKYASKLGLTRYSHDEF
ncbi:MAG: radical SAM protein [Candidatus Omnitrophica bacterium]|nr:radical SAM protein [Candidatus Omnitrophota bacterium]